MRLLLVANACLDLVDNQTGQRWCDALQRQIANDFAPLYERSCVVHYIGDSKTEHPESRDGLITLVRSSSDPGALGEHWIEGTRPIGEVGVQTCLDEDVRPARCLSHEGLETLADEYATACFQVGRLILAFEVCDRVEDSDNDYEIDGVAMENFSTPEAFLEGAPGPWDFRGRCPSNRVMPKGYQLFYDAKAAQWTQATGARARGSKHVATLNSRRAARLRRAGVDPKALVLVAA